MNTLDALTMVEQSKSAASLLGPDAQANYRKYAKLIHPDVVGDKLRPRAEIAFAKLSGAYELLNGKKITPAATVIGKWVVGDAIAKGDLCDLYHAQNSESVHGVFKIARSPKDVDLMEQERYALKTLHAAKGADNYGKYLPMLLDTLDASGRRVNVITAADGLTLAAIHEYYAGRVDFRHVVWMVNRALSVLGYAHRYGIIHGAVLPEHLIYGPVSHSLKLVDWCYSVTTESKKHIPAIVKERKDFYPAEIFRKAPAHSATDIYMLFRSMKMVAPIPPRFGPIFEWCMAASPKWRPTDAWKLQNQWVKLAREEYGEPRYLKLDIPIT